MSDLGVVPDNLVLCARLLAHAKSLTGVCRQGECQLSCVALVQSHTAKCHNFSSLLKPNQQ